MAIKSNKKIDFEYEYESQNVSYNISLRFYHTDDYGPTIAILDETGEPVINLPVAMFPEVSDFLSQQGIIESKKALSAPSIPTRVPKPVLSSRTSSPTKQKIVATRTVVNPLKVGNTNIQNVVPVDLEEEGEDMIDAPSDMRDLLRQEKNRIEGIQFAVQDSIPAQSLSSPANQEELSEDEMSEMMKRRQEAASKAKKAESSIRRKS